MGRPAASADVRRFRDAAQARAYLRRFTGVRDNLVALRAFLVEELLETGTVDLHDAEVIERAALHFAAGRAAVVERVAPPLTSWGDVVESAPPPAMERTRLREKTWIGIRLVDQDDQPIAGERYWIELPDGQIREGRLDADGRAYFGDLDPGDCEIRWPDLDEEATWPEAQKVRPAQPPRPPRPKKTWIEIALVGEDNKPLGGEAYCIVLPDGSKREGTLDAEGLARVDGVDPGSCEVTFPNLDKRAVERV